MPRKRSSNEVTRDRARDGRRRRAARGGVGGNGVRARAVAAGAILVIWGVSTVADIFTEAYSPPEGVSTLAIGAATYLFGSAFLRERG